MNIKSIPPIPELPPGLIIAAHRGTIVPFIGAGVPKLVGCPNWNEFADKIFNFLIKQGKYNYNQLALIGKYPPRRKLDVILSEYKLNIPYKEILSPVYNKDHEQGKMAYIYLCKIANSFVTTNYYDLLIEDQPSSEVSLNDKGISKNIVISSYKCFYKREEFTIDKLDMGNTVIQLHGSVSDHSSMILTTQDYIRHYANDRGFYKDTEKENRILTFLTNLFQHKTVLFIGYGLEELEVLEYVFLKSFNGNSDTNKFQSPRHYILQGFYGYQLEIVNMMAKYYQSFGIELIPFSLDTKEWIQLVDVLEYLSKVIPATKNLSMSKRSIMLELFNAI